MWRHLLLSHTILAIGGAATEYDVNGMSRKLHSIHLKVNNLDPAPALCWKSTNCIFSLAGIIFAS